MLDRYKKIALCIAVLGLAIVWFRNVQLLTGSASPLKDGRLPRIHQTGENVVTTSDSMWSGTFVYDPTSRDPFSLPELAQEKRTQRRPHQVKAPADTSSPRACMQGYVWQKGNAKLIIFDSVKEKSLLFSEGDTINEYIIHSVTENQVELVHGKRRIIWEAAE